MSTTPEERVGLRGEQKRRWDREHGRGTCKTCGAKTWKKRERCNTCFSAEITARKEERWREIQRLWNQGLTLIEIGRALGMSNKHVGVDIYYMRQEGWDVPYRHPRKARTS